MARKKLSALAIPKLSPGDWHDIIVPGLILRVGAKRQTWTYRYSAGGKKLRLTLGYHPVMGLAEAREACRKASERIDSGVTPKAPAPHPRSPSALTLGGLLDRYEALRVREGKKIKTLPEAMRLLRRSLAPYLSLPAGEFSKADLRAARDAMVEDDAVFAGNRMLAYLGPAMRWAAQEDLIPTNFVGDIRKAPERKRKRVLTKKEIAAIWKACDEFEGRPAAHNFGRMVRFLLATAQRRDDAASLRHGHILDGTWRQTTNKSDRPHSLNLPPLALKLVGQGTAQEYVFRRQRRQDFRVLETQSRARQGVRRQRLAAARSAAHRGDQHAGVGRTQRYRAGDAKSQLPGVGGVYLHAELEKQKAEALATWAVALAKIVRPVSLVAS